jgi:hypothetical protein
MRWFAAALLSLLCFLPPAFAQQPQSPGEDDEKAARVPALQYTVAVAITILMVTVVCMPSRKGMQD